MKRFLLLVASALTLATSQAMPVVPNPCGTFTVQPDGTSLQLVQRGDAFYNYHTTADGYTVVRGATGGYEYATAAGGRLAPSGVTAHDAAGRDAAERAYVCSLTRGLTDEAASREAIATKRRAAAAGPQRAEQYDYHNFRGLIVLVEYTDKGFQMDDPHSFYDHMVNDKDYSGYSGPDGEWVPCTGSVRDYYYDQSGGLFDPVFDIVGPVKAEYASTDHQSATNTAKIFKSVLDQIDPEVDFSVYDGDEDGFIDFVFFIGAGEAACYQGNDPDLLWPHAYVLSMQTLTKKYDGLYGYKYACCTEIYGWTEKPESLVTQGIGIMCHEFTHVLGLRDHYDANYDTNGLSHHPNNWDILAAGATLNSARTPVSFTLYERYALGWTRPQVIAAPGRYTLPPIDGTGQGYIIRTPVANEYFTLENRQPTKWDEYLPGRGMLVFRVDSTSTLPWTLNQVNANAAHNYYELLRAWNDTDDKDLDSDPFPGTMGITTITNATTPGLRTWSGVPIEWNIHQIAERGSDVTFFVTPDGMVPGDFESDLKGDLDGNGSLDIADVNELVNIILNPDLAANYGNRPYITDDGEVDVNDLNELINLLLKQ